MNSDHRKTFSINDIAITGFLLLRSLLSFIIISSVARRVPFPVIPLSLSPSLGDQHILALSPRLVPLYFSLAISVSSSELLIIMFPIPININETRFQTFSLSSLVRRTRSRFRDSPSRNLIGQCVSPGSRFLLAC